MAEINPELVGKLLELFRRYGIRSVTTNDIARELGISKKTLYEQFADKSAMVEQTIMLMYKHLETQLVAVKENKAGAIASLFTIFQRVNEFMLSTSPTMRYDLQKYYPELYQYAFRIFNEIIYNMQVENMEQGKAEGVYRDVDTDIIARVLTHKVQRSTMEIFTTEELYSGRVQRELLLYHLYGICNEKGHEQVNSWLSTHTDTNTKI